MKAGMYQYSKDPKKSIVKLSDQQVLTFLKESSMEIFSLNQRIDDEFSNTLYNSFHGPYLKHINDPGKYAKNLFNHINTNYSLFTVPLANLNMKEFLEANEKATILDHEKFEINYKKLLFLVCIINHLFKAEKEKNLKDILSGGPSSPQINEDIRIGGQYYLASLLDNFRTVKKVNFCLFKNKSPLTFSKDTPFIKEAILIFELFFLILFEGVMEVNFDLNIHPYNYQNFKLNYSPMLEQNQTQNQNQNQNQTQNQNQPPPPPQIPFITVLQSNEVYKDSIIANIILFRKLLSKTPLIRISITMSDSYQIESYSILTKELIFCDSPQGNYANNSTNEVKEGSNSSRKSATLTNCNIEHVKKIENILFNFNELCGKRNDLHIMEMAFHFNSLDPLLFKSINNIIRKNDDLADLKIKFFDLNRINIDKIRLNKFYFTEANKHQQYPSNDDAISLLKRLNEQESEKKLSNLFNLFNSHLEALVIAIQHNIGIYTNLSFDFSSGDNSDFQLHLNDDYKIAIAVFFFNILICFQSYEQEHKINSFTFVMDDVNQSNKYLFKKFKQQFEEYNQDINLSNTDITLINFTIPDISIILPFSHFPRKKLTSLELRSVTLTDFTNLCDELSKNIHLFQVLQEFTISFDYIHDKDLKEFKKLLKLFIENLLVPTLENLTMEFNHHIEKNDIIELLYNIRNSKFHSNVQGTMTYEFKLNDKTVYEFLVEKKQLVKTQGSFFYELDKMNAKRKIRYEQIQQNTRNYTSLDLNIFSNNTLVAIVYGFESVMNKKNIKKCKLDDVFKKVNKFLGKTRKQKIVHFTKTW